MNSLTNILVDGAAVSYNDSIYVFGGFDFNPSNFQGKKTWFNSQGQNGEINNSRRKHTATLVPDDQKVLIVGGYDSRPTIDAELFDLTTLTSTRFHITDYAGTEDAASVLICN